eukprot:1148859-Pelagomonas_calceolata.AAC.4
MAGSQCHSRKGVGSRGCGGDRAGYRSKLSELWQCTTRYYMVMLGGNLWTCKPLVGAWKGRFAWASAAQFLPHNSAATQYFIALSMQIDAKLKEEQIGTLFV